MKLRYIKLRNVLSFGDKEVNLDFDSFNIIAGPNDAGKTNLFRALSIIEKSFESQNSQLAENLFQGDINRPSHLEVGIELDEPEADLLSSAIVCSEIIRVQGQPGQTKEIQEDKRWKSILINYGKAILYKSFRNPSLVLHKGESRVSQARIAVLLSENGDSLYIDPAGYVSGTNRDPGRSFQVNSFAKEVIDDFNNRFRELSDSQIDLLLQDTEALLQKSPFLTTLLKGKLSGATNAVIAFQRFNLWDYNSYLSEEPILNQLLLLREIKAIKEDQVYFWGLISQFYKRSFVKVKELRLSDSAIMHSSNITDTKEPDVVGTDLSITLFKLMTASNRKDRNKYNLIRENFHNLTGLDFQISIRGKEMEVTSDELGVMPPDANGRPEFFPLVYKHQKTKRKLNEAFVQIIKANYPISIEETASGIHEILLLLTAIIGESEKVVLLDEPELHLHPQMQKRILDVISQSKNKEKNQILLITHSPYFTSAEDSNATWRFSAHADGTKVHNLAKVLSNLENQDKEKISLSLSNPDIRAILFSQGVILVEGPSDKLVVEQVDKFVSTKQKEANIDESEWPVLNIGGKNSLSNYLILSKLLGVNSLAIVDYDALMHREDKIKVNYKEIKTSAVFYALFHDAQENDLAKVNFLDDSDAEWYNNSKLETLRKLALEYKIFVFSKDLEGVMGASATNKRKKPLKALERILELIDKDNLPSEFIEMSNFLHKYTMKQEATA